VTDRREYDNAIRSAMVELTRNFATGTDLEQTLGSVTAAAVELVEGVDYADVLLIGDGRFRSVQPTSEVATRLDDVQEELRQGPCLQAALSEPLIRCDDLREDPRWPQFAAQAVAAGVHSMLSFQLYTHESGAGALNLFGRVAASFDGESETIGAMLATHAAIALIAADKQHQFESALASRDLIGQAKGIIMERFNVDALRAFELISRLSQNSNTQVRTIAEQIVQSRIL
jgi:transcriptional regulator with GAF, ATPase, and Fis domain